MSILRKPQNLDEIVLLLKSNAHLLLQSLSMVDVDVLQLLQRIFLSFNEIKSFDDISCLRRCPMLSEISLDGNPFTIVPNYRQITLHEISSLKILDVKRVTVWHIVGILLQKDMFVMQYEISNRSQEEERRIATVMVRREEERRKENDKLNSIKEKRRLAICNAQRQWNMQQQHQQRITRRDEKSASPSQNDYSVCHLAELDHNSLNLYGSGSLDALSKSWGEKKSIITTIAFRYIKFYEIVPFLSNLNATFPSLERLYFDLTNISSLQELNALAVMKKLSHLTITEEGNLVTNLSIWRLYVIYRLSHLELSTLNQKQITGDDVYDASNMFSQFTIYRISLISNAKLLVLFAEEGYEKLADSPAKSCLQYRGPSVKEKLEEAEHKSFASSFMREITKNTMMAERKQAVFQNDWFTVLNDIITKYFKDISNLDLHSQSSLEKIKKSVGIESSLSHYANQQKI